MTSPSHTKRVLVTWGSKRGGTEGIARIVADELKAHGFEVVEAPAGKARSDDFDAAIIGGALYANRWPASVRRFAARRIEQLRKVPVWLFSSGPLDDSAERADLPPVAEVDVLAERIGARGHVTFGGRLEPDAKGFPASAMAKTRAGDWRNPERIRAWAAGVAAELPDAGPGRHVEPRGRSVPRLIGYAVLGWMLVAVTTWILAHAVGAVGAAIGKNLAAALLFGAIAHRYFAARGARGPLPTAVSFTVVAGVLDLLLIPVETAAGAGAGSAIGSYWLPLVLIFVATWAAGAIMAMTPRRPPGPAQG